MVYAEIHEIKDCHIQAASELGPRYNPQQTEKERHGYANLIILCPNCHADIDKNPQKYSVEYLQNILFYFDLNKVNFPQQYKAVFYITDYFVLHHVFCRLLDVTNWIIAPPPEFTLSSTPSNVLLRPGAEKDLEVVVKGNSNVPSGIF